MTDTPITTRLEELRIALAVCSANDEDAAVRYEDAVKTMRKVTTAENIDAVGRAAHGWAGHRETLCVVRLNFEREYRRASRRK